MFLQGKPFAENLTSYKHLQNGIPALFWYNAFMIASNGSDSRVGSLTADWERFTEWKRIEREDEPRPSLPVEDVMANAPDAAADAGLFRVPRVIGG